jgi:hypothetical protein
MAVQLNIPGGVDWPVQFRQQFFGVTWGFTLRENQLLDDNRATIDISADGDKLLEGRILLIGNTIGASNAEMDAVFYALPEGSSIVQPTQERIRDGVVNIFGSQKNA